jgi:hypothetical protein
VLELISTKSSTKAKVSYRVILEVILVSFLCPIKNDVAFKITT